MNYSSCYPPFDLLQTALELLHFAADTLSLSAKRCLNPRGSPLTLRYSGNVRATIRAEAEFFGDPGVNASGQFGAVNVGYLSHVFCSRHTVASDRNENIPVPIIRQGESVPISTTSIPAWAEKIAATRKRLRMSQRGFAEALETSQSNVSKYESGEQKPSPALFMKLAKLAEGEVDSLLFLEMGGVPASWFLGEDGSGTGAVPVAVAEEAVRKAKEDRAAELTASDFIQGLTNESRSVPLLRDPAAAGSPLAVRDGDVEQIIQLPRQWLPRGGKLFALRVSGDSMSPILLDGHVVIVDVSKNEAAKLVQHMVAARDSDGVTIKWLRKEADIYMLVAQHTAPEYGVRFLKPLGDFDLVGEVVMWIGQPPPAKRK